MRGVGSLQEKRSKSLGLDRPHIMCCCPEKEAEKELDAGSPIAPCTTPAPTNRVLSLGTLPTRSVPRKEDPLSSQGLLSSRSCILGWRPILLVSNSHGLSWEFPWCQSFPAPSICSLNIPYPPPARIEATIARVHWASYRFRGARYSLPPINTPTP